MANHPLPFSDLVTRQARNRAEPRQGWDNVDEGNNAFLDAAGNLTFRASCYGEPASFGHVFGAARLRAVSAYVSRSSRLR